MTIPRNEYPRPQFRRQHWMCLNGEWEFEIDHGDSGLERGLIECELNSKINVPFCPESKLSGVEYTDFMNTVWYRREIEIPQEWNKKKVLLHFQACDYDTTVWINGHKLGTHRGGFTPFSFDISPYTKADEKIILVVRARDNAYEHKAGGKQQLDKYKNAGCHYYRTTGIWQTVWLEPVSEINLQRPRITPNLANQCFHIEQQITGNPQGITFRAILKDDQGEVCCVETLADKDFSVCCTLDIPTGKLKLWEPGSPFLYDIDLELIDSTGTIIDQASSYAGMRSICLQGKKILINGKPIFQRQVLDQGYYSDGIMTAPDDEALKLDIELAIKAGFNSARLHQKLFEERFLYHADKMGYMVWGEFGDWGVHHEDGNYKQIEAFLHHPHNAMFQQWLEALNRDYSHPCIVGWCPLNESHRRPDDNINSLDDLTRGLFLATKAMDTSRPVLDCSGYSHRVLNTDVYDSHNYAQNPVDFAKDMEGLSNNNPYVNKNASGDIINTPYNGQPYFCSEFGGIKWNPSFADAKSSWGYGETPKSLDEFYERFEGLINVLLDNSDMFGYCYTQLTDVFQEQNGIYFFDRSLKFDMEKIKKIQTRKAAMEIAKV